WAPAQYQHQFAGWWFGHPFYGQERRKRRVGRHRGHIVAAMPAERGFRTQAARLVIEKVVPLDAIDPGHDLLAIQKEPGVKRFTVLAREIGLGRHVERFECGLTRAPLKMMPKLVGQCLPRLL